MSYNESETRFFLFDPVLRAKGFDDHSKLRLETPAPVEPTGNPRACVGRDERTPTEIIASIAAHGRTVDAALTRLNALLAVGDRTEGAE